MYDSPHVDFYRSEPMSAVEIDAHPDCGRIWASIEAIKARSANEFESLLDDQSAVLESIREALEGGMKDEDADVEALEGAIAAALSIVEANV